MAVSGSSGRGAVTVAGSGGPGGGPQSREGASEVICPGPVLVEPELPALAGPDQAAGHVGDAVAERGGLAAGEGAGEAQGPGPGEQVGGGQGQLEPGLVLLICPAGQVAQARGLARPDPVLDPGMRSVPDFQVGELAAGGIGEERGEPVPAGVGEAQLRAGVGPFPADDQPGALAAMPPGSRSR